VVVEVIMSNDTDLVQDITKIPRVIYILFTAIYFMSSYIWLFGEWFLRRWSRYKGRNNVVLFYFAMIVTTTVLIIIHLAVGRGLFDFLTMIPIFYLTFIFIYVVWSYSGVEVIRKEFEKRWENWTVTKV
jgi:hypothetical protein